MAVVVKRLPAPAPPPGVEVTRFAPWEAPEGAPPRRLVGIQEPQDVAGRRMATNTYRYCEDWEAWGRRVLTWATRTDDLRLHGSEDLIDCGEVEGVRIQAQAVLDRLRDAGRFLSPPDQCQAARLEVGRANDRVGALKGRWCQGGEKPEGRQKFSSDQVECENTHSLKGLQRLAWQHGLDSTGTKRQLCERLVGAGVV